MIPYFEAVNLIMASASFSFILIPSMVSDFHFSERLLFCNRTNKYSKLLSVSSTPSLSFF